MKAKIDNCEISLENFKVRAFNFGQHWRAPDIVNHVYELWLDYEVFENYFSPFWEELISDASSVDADDYLDLEFVNCGLPSLDKLRIEPQNYKQLLKILIDYFGYDMLLNHFGATGGDKENWAINTFDKADFCESGIYLTGDCRNNQVPGYFQDY